MLPIPGPLTEGISSRPLGGGGAGIEAVSPESRRLQLACLFPPNRSTYRCQLQPTLVVRQTKPTAQLNSSPSTDQFQGPAGRQWENQTETLEGLKSSTGPTEVKMDRPT